MLDGYDRGVEAAGPQACAKIAALDDQSAVWAGMSNGPREAPGATQHLAPTSEAERAIGRVSSP